MVFFDGHSDALRKLVEDICWKPLVLEFFNSRNLGKPENRLRDLEFFQNVKEKAYADGKGQPSLIRAKKG